MKMFDNMVKQAFFFLGQEILSGRSGFIDLKLFVAG